ncbi:MAG: thiamine pyrophosphate-binding protein [Chloroflexota bacterium]|jgi:benzoylformate decarboxylase|uniref:Thiamine pyrophosphate-binding protein n=1 Tax=marine metagenome TaxID=408172 RepID=A0A381U934_9ZZZZ|nr:thiamine pyrophosphate-binding protein [Chloroflexota bacterium]|tara:strand:+ start:1274 stop:2935 length:1662 start_codon:yes stop_codon:yes gene_type:complete
MSQLMSGKQAVMEMLKAEGIEYIFGNPGTSEGPLIDMLGEYPEFKYIMALQESVAMGMGESYARSTNRTSFVSLHVDSGLANGIALMLDALNTGTPMVVTSANYDARKISENKTDLAQLVRPVTKWSVELDLPDQIPSVMRRAFNEANSHPKGPVYVGFTANALEGIAEMNIVPSAPVHDAVRPDPEGIRVAAEMLRDSRSPLLIVGDRVSDDGGVGCAVELAEIVGMPVYQSRGAEVSFPTNHPQYLGVHSLRVASDREALKGYDVILTVGMDTFDELFYWGDVILGENTSLIHIDPIPGRVGKTEPTNLGIISNCKAALEMLSNALKDSVNKEIANKLRKESVKLAMEERQTYEDSVSSKWKNTPMSPARMMYELSKSVPSNSIIVDDSVSNRAALRHYFEGINRDDIRGVRGQSIGGGIGATMGTKCAFPDRPVIGIIGDGSAMMTIQGLWTAANDDIPCVFVICNNGMYRVLKVNFNIYQTELLKETEPAGENLLYSNFETPFDISEIAKGMGLHSERVTDPSEIAPAVNRAISTGKPAVLDIVIDGSL